MELDDEDEGREGLLGGAGGSGAEFTLVASDSHEVLDELVLRLVLELRRLSKERWLTGRLRVR